MKAKAFDKIHNINPTFNRIFSGPLFVASFIVVLLFAVSPYSVRFLLSVLINLFFNRPLVYLTYFSKLVAKPMNLLTATILYLVLVGVYALPIRLARATGLTKARRGWIPSEPATDGDGLYFQS